MSGKYYIYDSGQSYVSIPKSIAEALGWSNQTKIKIEIKNIDNTLGVFLSKSEELFDLAEYLKKKEKK